jgi:hypothetical protein
MDRRPEIGVAGEIDQHRATRGKRPDLLIGDRVGVDAELPHEAEVLG